MPYFIDNLGVAAYGIIPLATAMTSYVNLVIQSLNTSVSRYLTIDLLKKDFKKANVTFNTALFGTLGIIVLMIPIVFIVSYYAPVFFEIPLNQNHDAFLLFMGVIIAFLIRTWGSNFGVSLFAYNRLDLQNIVNIINVTVQVLLMVVLFSIFTPKLSYIGISYLIGAITSFAFTLFFSKKINPHMKINFRDFQLSQLKHLTETGGWIIVNQIGALLFLQVDLMVVNKLFGAAAGGEYAIVLTWSTLLRAVAGMLSGVLVPIIYTYYAQKKYEEIITLSKSAVKFMGFAMALPIGFICGFAPQILSLWVGPEFIKLSLLMWIILIHLVINLSVLPLFPINVSFNKVRIPGIVTLVMGIGNFLLAIIIPYITGWGYYGVAVAGMIMLTIKNSLFTPWYATKVMGISSNTYIKSMIPGVLSALVIAGVINILNDYFDISTLSQLVMCGSMLFLIYFIPVWFICLDQSEKGIIKSFIPSVIRSRLKLEIQYH